MAKRKIPLGEVNTELLNHIADIIDDYQKELEINIDDTLKEVSHDFKDELYKVTPVGPGNPPEGHLRDNLNVKRWKRQGYTVYTLGFGKKGWLSTLLEYGVRYKNGKFYKHPFVRPLWDKKKDGYFKKIKEAAERSGVNDNK